MRAPSNSSPGSLPGRARESRTGEHAILGANPSTAAVAKKLRDTFFNRSGTNDASVPHLNQGRAFGGSDEIRDDPYWAELIGRTIVGAIKHSEILASPGI